MQQIEDTASRVGPRDDDDDGSGNVLHWQLQDVVIHGGNEEIIQQSCQEDEAILSRRGVDGVCKGPVMESGSGLRSDHLRDLGQRASLKSRIMSEMKRISTFRINTKDQSGNGSSMDNTNSNMAGYTTRRRPSKIHRTVSSAERGLKSLRFLDKSAAGGDNNAWETVERCFDQIADKDGRVSRENFGCCIGMKDSKEFAMELFDAMARRKGLKTSSLSKDDLQGFWLEMADQNFDSRLQIFFDMCDKNGDGRISEEEVKEVIGLSASANKLAELKRNAAEYAALIMEELDPDNLGYIEIWQLEILLQGMARDNRSEECLKYNKTLRKTMTLKRWRSPSYRLLQKSKDFTHEHWRHIWVVLLWMAVNIGLFIWKFM